ncbi:hypothetical protein ACKWTF_010847 [Chironomus riparius]
MKELIIFCSLFIVIHCSDTLNDTVKSTTSDVVVESDPQPLVELSKLKNSTKDAAERIIKLFTKEQTPVTTEKPFEFTEHPLFDSFNQYLRPYSIFGLHKSPERPIIRNSEERLCTCRTEYSIPSFSSFIPSSPSSSSSSSDFNFNSRDIPTFEVVYPSKEYSSFLNTVESPSSNREIINQYPPIDYKDLWKYQDSSVQSIDKK